MFFPTRMHERDLCFEYLLGGILEKHVSSKIIQYIDNIITCEDNVIPIYIPVGGSLFTLSTGYDLLCPLPAEPPFRLFNDVPSSTWRTEVNHPASWSSFAASMLT
jgi:hypothetical protein